MEGQHAQTLWEAAVVPAVSGLLVTLGVVLLTARRPAPRPPPWARLGSDGRRALLVDTARRLLAGYLTCLLVVLVYSRLLQHDDTALTSAATGIPFILLLASPAWVVLSWCSGRCRQRRRRGAFLSRGRLDEGDPGPPQAETSNER
jgi:hypothetical protein